MSSPTSSVLPGAAPAAPARPGTPAATEAQGDHFARLVERHLADERPNRAASDTPRERPEDRPSRTTPTDRARRADRPGSRPQALRGHEDDAPAHDPQAAAATAQGAAMQDAARTPPATTGAGTTGFRAAGPAGTANGGELAIAGLPAGVAATADASGTARPAVAGAPTPAAAAQLDALVRAAGVPVTVVAASSTPAPTVTPAVTASAAATAGQVVAPAGTGTPAPRPDPAGTGAATTAATSPTPAVGGGAQAHPGSQDGTGHDAERGPVPVPAATPGATGNAAVTGPAVAATAAGPQAATGSPVLDQVLPAVPTLAAKGQGVHSLTLRLHPADLGEVHLTVTVRGDKVDVTIAAGDRARDVLREGSSQLRSLLDLAGHTAGSVTVRDLPGSSAAVAAPAGQGTTGQGTRHDAGSGEPQGFVAGQGSQPDQQGAQERGRSGGDVPAASPRPDGHGRTTQPVRPRAAGTSALDVTI